MLPLSGLGRWQLLAEGKRYPGFLYLGVAALLGGLLVYLAAAQREAALFPPLVILVLLGAFLAGARGGFVASAGAGVALYLSRPDAGVLELASLVVAGLLVGTLRDHMKRTRRQLSALRRIDLAILSGAPLRRITNTIVDEVIKLLKVDDARIFIYEPRENVLKVIQDLRFPPDPVVPWVYHHHERWDGQGYPDGLKGEEIPLEARILLVADAYDAMTSNRPYRKALSKEQAREELARNASSQFDPELVGYFLEVARHPD